MAASFEKKLQQQSGAHPTAEDVVGFAQSVLAKPRLQNETLYRAYFYDAPPSDLVPALQQKGVDIRIALDIANLAAKRIANILVLVTGDADLVPAMKFARKEGMRVYLETMGHGVHRELKAHVDFVL